MVKLTIGEQTYKKDEPTVADWHDYLARTEATKDKNLLIDVDMSETTENAIRKYLNIPAEISFDGLKLREIIEAYQSIQRDMVGVFTDVNKLMGKSGNGKKAAVKS